MNTGKDATISILLTGDFAPVGIAEIKNGSSLKLQVADELTELFNGADIRIANLECPLTLAESRIVKTGPNLKVHPASINTLKRFGIDVVCLSNNHIRDYGDQGVLDTLNVCHQSGIRTVGAGKDFKDAAKPLLINLKSKKIAILNFSESEYNEADDTRAGSNPDDIFHIWYSIQQAKAVSDYQIVIMHGGREMHPYPTPYQLKLFRFIADQGVDAVIGHHTHVIGGYEIYKSVPLIYSLGNFIFDEAGNPAEWYHGAIAKIYLNNRNRPEVEFSHIMFHDSQLDLLESVSINDSYNSFIKPVNLVQVNDQWQKLVRKYYLSEIKSLLNLNFLSRILVKLKIKNIKNRTRHLLVMGNRFRCKSHSIFTLDSIDFFNNK